jgi:hypothetical protein
MIFPGATLKYSKSFAAQGVAAVVAVTAGLLIVIKQSVVANSLTYLHWSEIAELFAAELV